MATEFDLITRASIRLDANAVSSFADGTREVEVFEPLYAPAVKSELASYTWNFNTFTEKLSQEVGTPVDGAWDFIWLEPSDMLKLNDVMDDAGTSMAYIHEQGRIFTNLENAFAKYQRNIDEADFPIFFQDLIVARLMMEAAEALNGDAGVVTRAENNYPRVRRWAKRIDGQENQARPLIHTQSPWLRAQFGGSSSRRFKPFGS